MPALAELLELRDRLWCHVRELPGVVTVGIGFSGNQSALIVFVEGDKVDSDVLPDVYEDVPVIMESAGKVKAHGE